MRILITAPWIASAEGVELETSTSELLRTSDPAHAELVPGIDFELQITREDASHIRVTTSKRRVVHRGKTRRSSVLAPGESCLIGGYTLRVESSTADDGGTRLVFGYAPIRAVDEGARTSLFLAGWRARRWSFILVAVMACFAFLTPFLSTLDSALMTNEAANQPGATESLLPMPVRRLLPTKDAWSAGPVHEAHHAAGIGSDCTACHTRAFQSIPDSACLTCHEQVREHALLTISNHAALTESTCADCHAEHIEPSALVTGSATLCVDCHQAARPWSPNMPVVSAFSTAGHPQFEVSLWRENPSADASADTRWIRVKQIHSNTERARESSNLTFPHELHLNSDNVALMNEGQTLVCANCHRIDQSNGDVTPVEMTRDCGACHALTLDLAAPDLRLTHGSERVVIAELRAHFMRKAAGANPAVAERRLRQEVAHQFGSAGCGLCHDVRQRPDETIEDSWRVAPVRIADDWYRGARFDHRPHLTNPGINGKAVSCLDCHAADTSSSAQDVLMPVLDTCLSCHNSERIEQAGICLDCHGYHSAFGTPSVEARGHVMPIEYRVPAP
ncbi:MAG: cytochrome c3 family protein [Pseudomonadales bacterium]